MPDLKLLFKQDQLLLVNELLGDLLRELLTQLQPQLLLQPLPHATKYILMQMLEMSYLPLHPTAQLEFTLAALYSRTP